MSNEKPVRGEVWDVDLDPVLGHEQGRKRPALVFRPSSIDGQRSPEFLEYPGLPVSRTCQSKIVGTLVARGLTLCSLHDKAILFAEFMRLV